MISSSLAWDGEADSLCLYVPLPQVIETADRYDYDVVRVRGGMPVVYSYSPLHSDLVRVPLASSPLGAHGTWTEA